MVEMSGIPSDHSTIGSNAYAKKTADCGSRMGERRRSGYGRGIVHPGKACQER